MFLNNKTAKCRLAWGRKRKHEGMYASSVSGPGSATLNPGLRSSGVQPTPVEKRSVKDGQERAQLTHTARRSRKEEVGWDTMCTLW